MSNSSLGIRVGIHPEVAQRLREQSSSSQQQDTTTGTRGDLSTRRQQQETSPSNQTSSNPETLPGVLIDIQTLVGYLPNDSDEVELVQTQLLEAMWARYELEHTTPKKFHDAGNHGLLPPPDFDIQILELFDSGLARYCDDGLTTTTTTTSPQHNIPLLRDDGRLFIRYPRYLQSPVTGEHISTITLIQELRKPPTLAFLQKLWKYLAECSRTLFWKRDMAVELLHLIREEQAHMEYQEWKESKRQSKLDNLYSIRETLVHQVEMAKAKVDVLEEEREDQVKIAMEPIHRKTLQKEPDSMNAFGTSELSFPDEFQWLGLRDDPPLQEEEEDDWGRDSNDSYGDEIDDDSDGTDDDAFDDDDHDDDDDDDSFNGDVSSVDERGSQVQIGDSSTDIMADEGHPTSTDSPFLTTPESILQQGEESAEITDDSMLKNVGDDDGLVSGDGPALLLPFQKRKKRREKAKRRRQQDRKMAERKAREEQLQKIESQLRTKFTGKELIIAQTMHNALVEKMTKVEDLLDSLQDEVWQAEEEEEGQEVDDDANKNPSDDRGEEPTFSLLDQVLAMILGATPVVGGMKPEEHYLSLQVEHRRIVQAWKSHFGRLPPPAGFTSNPSQKPTPEEEEEPSPVPRTQEDPVNSKEKRQQLGITENNDDDWEALDNLLDDGNASKTKLPTRDIDVAPTKPPMKPYVPETLPPPRLVGLRPGGRVVRPTS